ncbi:pyridoxal phosphate-dependent aminotransferase [Alkaliphilus peptidifermentans]|uniref:Aminotransferase n=1 Tax=Alkaliphilus peptidifermentans DSM 18978 TaxID=1120976 RepID=A0A1G5DA70_9FIRM|nr:pyridoxal phosphate-dependent aminotransferase [Alkaliphilus peptidifermentans]SCY11340.1 L-aspartate aminotransferase apoenzyme [Alkaliphilus peptidifermentans DSM 18978]
MKIKLSEKSQKITASVTLAIDAKAKQMMAEGIDVISFGVGEPDFNTPENINRAAIEALDKGITRYTAASGLPLYREVICKKLKDDNNLEYKPENIVVSNGAKHSLYNALLAICNPGDEVIIPVPYWVSYEELVKMADAIPVFVKCSEENEFKMKRNDLLAAITPNTKAILLNSPSNPTGSSYTKDELQMIADIAVEKGIIVIADEIYEKLVYDGAEHISIASLNEKIKDQTIVVNGMSKAYAMTGWRIGYTASNKEIAKIMGNIQSHATSHPNTIAMYASAKALMEDQSSVEEMRKAFDERRKYMVERINQIDGVSCITPKGAFYIMMNISKLKGKEIAGKLIEGSMDFAEICLDKSHVAVVPGMAFGVDDFVRLSYANSMENIRKGLDRIESLIKG